MSSPFLFPVTSPFSPVIVLALPPGGVFARGTFITLRRQFLGTQIELHSFLPLGTRFPWLRNWTCTSYIPCIHHIVSHENLLMVRRNVPTHHDDERARIQKEHSHCHPTACSENRAPSRCRDSRALGGREGACSPLEACWCRWVEDSLRGCTGRLAVGNQLGCRGRSAVGSRLGCRAPSGVEGSS